jgi:hypothetical protein
MRIRKFHPSVVSNKESEAMGIPTRLFRETFFYGCPKLPAQHLFFLGKKTGAPVPQSGKQQEPPMIQSQRLFRRIVFDNPIWRPTCWCWRPFCSFSGELPCQLFPIFMPTDLKHGFVIKTSIFQVIFIIEANWNRPAKSEFS